jgi:hypothetical protein
MAHLIPLTMIAFYLAIVRIESLQTIETDLASRNGLSLFPGTSSRRPRASPLNNP